MGDGQAEGVYFGSIVGCENNRKSYNRKLVFKNYLTG